MKMRLWIVSIIFLTIFCTTHYWGQWLQDWNRARLARMNATEPEDFRGTKPTYGPVQCPDNMPPVFIGDGRYVCIDKK